MFRRLWQAGASFIISTITSAKGVKDAGVASIAGTDVSSSTAELLQPLRGAFKGLQAKTMLITVETASINLTLDGTTPTVTAGTNLCHALDAGQSSS